MVSRVMTSRAAVLLARRLVNTLPAGGDTLFNPWKDRCIDDEAANSPAAKVIRLAAHLDCDPAYILCGEAPGYQGCRHSGVAFTSERLLLEGAIPRVPQETARLTRRSLPYSEPSATIVWKTLYRLGIAERVVLWNAVQLHPHRAGEHCTNRTPTPAEIALGAPAMAILVDAFPDARIIAVGKKASGLLADMGIPVAADVRHPANGGARQFAEGLAEIVGATPLARG